MLTRRFVISAAFLAPLAALAHEGHDLSRIEAEVMATQPTDRGLEITLALRNGRDAPIALQAVYSDLGDVALQPSPALAPDAAARVDVQILASDWPGIFTLILDFGEAGMGPVTVLPG